MEGDLTLPEGSAVSFVPLLVTSTESAGLSEDMLSERLEEEEEPLAFLLKEKRILKYQGSLQVGLQ